MRPTNESAAGTGIRAARKVNVNALGGRPNHTAAEARRASIASGARFRRDWRDSPRWAELAKRRGLRLPQWHTAPTARALKTWARIAGNLDFEATFGCSPSRLIELDPAVPLRAFAGWVLEAAQEGSDAQ
jgi:hypothetical protein